MAVSRVDTVRGRILVVDDESSVRLALELALRRAGTSVVSAPSGDAAVERFREDPFAFDLVLLDLSMPGLSGDETLLALRAIRSDLLIVMISGHDEHEQASRIRSLGYSGFVQKPFEPESLCRTVERLLNSQSNTAH